MRKVMLKRILPALGLIAVVAVAGLLDLRPGGSYGIAVAAENVQPGIVPIPLSTPLTERAVYPPGVPMGGFDGAYKMATMYKSGVYAGNKVAFWESEAGVLKSSNYPMDEFIYVLEGIVVTTDADGTRREFRAGDTFVLPKGWVGTWDMKTHFKKIIVNF
jgi:uncharacterized cupin superfamily protein